MRSRYDQPDDDPRDTWPRPHRCETQGCTGWVTFPEVEAFCTRCMIRHRELLDRLRQKAERQRQDIR